MALRLVGTRSPRVPVLRVRLALLRDRRRASGTVAALFAFARFFVRLSTSYGRATPERAGAHPYRRRRSGSVLLLLRCIPTISTLTRNKGLRAGSFLNASWTGVKSYLLGENRGSWS